MPLNGRNVLNLISLAPSVVPQGGADGSLTGKNVFAAGNYQIGGGTANQSASFFDGVTVQDTAYGNIVVLTPSPDSVEEFSVQTNSSSAEFGRFTGGVVNMASRSGSNALPRQPVRVPPQPGAQLQHLLRREGRAGEAALQAEQLRRHASAAPSCATSCSSSRATRATATRKASCCAAPCRRRRCAPATSPTSATRPPGRSCRSTTRGRSAASTTPAPGPTTATAARCRTACSSPATSFRPTASTRSPARCWPSRSMPTRPCRARGATTTTRPTPRSAATTTSSISGATTTSTRTSA